jgi:hypothetical protein
VLLRTCRFTCTDEIFGNYRAATGLPLPQLVDRIIQTALRKRPPRP